LALATPALAQVQHTGDICASNAEPEKVIEDCTAELKADYLYANAAIAYNNRAIAYMRLKKYDLAIRDLTLAIKAAPPWIVPLVNRAAAYRLNGQPDLARADLIALTKRGASGAEEHLAKADAFAELGDFPAAIAEFTIGIRQRSTYKPDMISLYVGRARAYVQTRQYALAADDLTQLIGLEPDHRDLLHSRASAYDLSGQFERARADTDAIAKAEPDSAWGQNMVCWTRAELGQELDIARSACDAAIRLGGARPGFLNSRGLLNLKQQRNQDAWADYDVAVRANDKDANSLYGRGIAALRLGRTAEGQSDIATALAQNPKIAEIYAGYGITS
jgi:tetratricopeptide (TPR) repeat protein